MPQQPEDSPQGRARFWRWPWRADPAQAARRRAALRLYAALVGQARSAAFYTILGVPDTPEGRFELIGLHAALIMRRLKDGGEAGHALGQELFDLMFADLDVNLRELGIGDLSVGKYVKRFARQFFARIALLEQGLAGGGGQALDPALRANVYRGGPDPAPEQVAGLVRYLVALDHDLQRQPDLALLRGEVAFPAPLLPAQEVEALE